MSESEAGIETWSLCGRPGSTGHRLRDIGTSPICALRECFRGISPVPITEANILGILSSIYWALIIVISLKYTFFYSPCQ
ncbi:MAG: K+ transporter [Marinobacter maritimus]|jgi:K+ transporter